ncbi:MAG: hypothetical protein KDB40_09645 [Acidimicrobiales bacterium]|nr:hypothetical protein [Acidimicrobiales bacterium]
MHALRGRSAGAPLRITASLTVAEYVVPRWLHANRTAGGPPVELAVANSVAVVRSVVDGAAELGFVETPRRFAGVTTASVGGDRLVVVVGAGHPWSRRRSSLSPAELAATPLLCREAGSGTRDAFEAALARLELVPAAPLAVLASTTTLKAATTAGDGACVLSALAVAGELADGRLVEVPVHDFDLSREFRAVWPAGRASDAAQRFVKLARRVGVSP